MSQTYTPISLGFSCEVKYQIMRTLKGGRAEADAPVWAAALESPTANASRQIFDWQITPLPAVINYLERDFSGVFERQDLHFDEAYGEVVHRDLDTRHPHEFHATSGWRISPSDIDDQYEKARSKFEYLAARFRRLLASPGRYLYICTDAREDKLLRRLLDLLGERSADHEFHLLMVAFEPWSPRLEAFDGQVSRDMRPPISNKPPAFDWQGDDLQWDRILKDFHLRPDHAAAGAPSPLGWLRRLMTR